MAQPTNLFHTADAVGLREDLSDIIYNISPTETPFLTMAGRGTATGTKHEWQVDELAPAAANAVVEGNDAAATTEQPTERVSNHCQISDKVALVSGTIEAVDKAGRQSELSYLLAKKSKELKRDIEFNCVGVSNTAVARSGSSTAGESASLNAFFNVDLAGGPSNTSATNLSGLHQSRGATAVDGGFSNVDVFTAPTDGTQRALLESDLKSVIQGAWTNGGDPSVIMAGPFNKTVISSFTGNSTRMDVGEDKRLVAAIDVYVSDFGEHKVVPNRFQRSRDVYCLTPELWEVAYLRDFRQHALSKTGDSEKRQILAEWTLVGKNQSGNAVVADLTTS